MWTSLTDEAFHHLKNALSQAPVLAILDFKKQFVLETDAGDIGFGAVLMQEGHPIAYLSKPVCAKNQALSTYEKECMAIILAMENGDHIYYIRSSSSGLTIEVCYISLSRESQPSFNKRHCSN